MGPVALARCFGQAARSFHPQTLSLYPRASQRDSAIAASAPSPVAGDCTPLQLAAVTSDVREVDSGNDYHVLFRGYSLSPISCLFCTGLVDLEA